MSHQHEIRISRDAGLKPWRGSMRVRGAPGTGIECRTAPWPSLGQEGTRRMIERANLEWKAHGLHLYGKGKPVVTIVPDAKYPAMWRVRLPDGRLTDMANRTRAKDAAASIALGILGRSVE